ncbi:hypothetical protein D4R87_00205 [bacterium]|nr:MAG: hypothetical protein D4R87_00205 [bacterium]
MQIEIDKEKGLRRTFQIKEIKGIEERELKGKWRKIKEDILADINIGMRKKNGITYYEKIIILQVYSFRFNFPDVYTLQGYIYKGRAYFNGRSEPLPRGIFIIIVENKYPTVRFDLTVGLAVQGFIVEKVQGVDDDVIYDMAKKLLIQPWMLLKKKVCV